MASAPRKPRIKIGVIGLGIIGSRVATNLRGAGHQVYVWSRSPRRAPNFLGSVVEVADLSDVIQVFVSDDAALLEVTRTIAAALSPRHLFASHATVSPEAARQAASIIEGQGARYLDAPFTGSKTAAQNRQLVYYVGSSREALEEIRPVLEISSKKIVHVGGVGDASVIKIATNMLTASTVQTLAEALALVRAAGVADQKFVEALENNGSRSGTSDLKLPAMITQNFEPNFSLKHMLKDARLALDLADSLELSLPVTETTAEVLSLGMENGWADQDFCSVTQLYPAPERADRTGAPDDAADTPARPTNDAHDAPGTPEATGILPEPSRESDDPPISPAPAQRQPILRAGPDTHKKSTLRVLRDWFKPPAARGKSSKPKRSPSTAPAKGESTPAATGQPVATGNADPAKKIEHPAPEENSGVTAAPEH